MPSKALLCGCLSDVHQEHFLQSLNHPGIDMVEWRLDLFIRHHSMSKAQEMFSLLRSSPRHPVLVTYRPKRQGGVFEGPETLRIETIQRAVEAGAEWTDLEEDLSEGALKEFLSGKARVLLSHHDFSGTPEKSILRRKMEQMAQRGVQIVKIITYAHTPEDNLRVLDLIAFGRREFKVDVIAFCMGPLGRWSRAICLLLGSPWTYVQLPGQAPSAPGQFTATEMRTLLENLT